MNTTVADFFFQKELLEQEGKEEEKREKREEIMSSEGGKAVVSMEQIVQFKENIQPVRGGRSASALARTVNSGSKLQLELEQTKQKFEQQITHEENENVADPLTIWFKYVTWAQVKYCFFFPSIFSFVFFSILLCLFFLAHFRKEFFFFSLFFSKEKLSQE